MSKLPKGTKVRRGRDWKCEYKDQDGGPLGIGKVYQYDKLVDLFGTGSGWVRVQWDNGNVYQYRWGAERSFDLEIIP